MDKADRQNVFWHKAGRTFAYLRGENRLDRASKGNLLSSNQWHELDIHTAMATVGTAFGDLQKEVPALLLPELAHDSDLFQRPNFRFLVDPGRKAVHLSSLSWHSSVQVDVDLSSFAIRRISSANLQSKRNEVAACVYSEVDFDGSIPIELFSTCEPSELIISFLRDLPDSGVL